MNTTSKYCHCWFSEEQAEIAGCCIYKINGQERIVTEVISMDYQEINYPNGYTPKWKDSQYIGAGTFVRRVTYGTYGKIPRYIHDYPQQYYSTTVRILKFRQ